MKRKAVVLLALAVVILPAVTLGIAWRKGLLSDKEASLATARQTETFDRVHPRPPVETPIIGEKVSVDEAQSRVPWRIPLPFYTIGATKLEEVWVSHERTVPQERQVYLIYSNGLEISIWPEASAPSWPALTQPPFRDVRIRGYAGRGKGPGVQQIPGYDENRYPASIQWWENGLMVNIYGSFPLEELLKVAESMAQVSWISTR